MLGEGGRVEHVSYTSRPKGRRDLVPLVALSLFTGVIAAMVQSWGSVAAAALPLAVLFAASMRRLRERARMLRVRLDDGVWVDDAKLFETRQIRAIGIRSNENLLTIEHDRGSVAFPFDDGRRLKAAAADLKLPPDRTVTIRTPGTTITVGVDGIELRGHVHPFSELELVDTRGGALEIRSQRSGMVQLSGAAASLVARRIREARAQSPATPNDTIMADAGTPLERTRRLRDVAERSGYRAAALRVSDLWSIVASGAAGPIERASAAIALSASALSKGERERLRQLAGASVISSVSRTFVRVAADAPEEELADLLDEATRAHAPLRK